MHGVAHEPNYCLTRVRIVKHKVRVAVSIEITSRYQIPTTGQRRALIRIKKRDSRQMPDHRPACGRIEQQIVRMTVAIKIRNRPNLPAAGKSGAGPRTR